MTGRINNLEVPDLKLLVSFLRVARLSSISAAANELGYVPSAVSQHISSLERALGGTPVFIRNPGAKLQLTAAGRTLFEHASDLLTAATVFTDAAKTLSEGTGIEIRVGAYGSALSHLLIPARACQSAVHGNLDGRDQNLVMKRLFDKIDCAGLHRLHRQRYIAMPGHDDNRQVDLADF